jgi:hypothetical protein
MSMLTLQILFAPATNARGVPMAALRITMIGSVVMPIAYFIGSHWGVTGFAWAWVGGMTVLTTATVILSGGIIGLTIRGLVRAVLPPLMAALVMAGGVSLVMMNLPKVPDLAALAIAVPVGVALYLGALKLIAPERLAEALHFVRHRSDDESLPEPARAPAE